MRHGKGVSIVIDLKGVSRSINWGPKSLSSLHGLVSVISFSKKKKIKENNIMRGRRPPWRAVQFYVSQL